MLDANATVEWTPAFYQKRMDDWLRNMGDWNISRKRLRQAAAAVLPVRVRAPDGDRLTENSSGARCGFGDLRELHRPWIDDVVIACEKCGEEFGGSRRSAMRGSMRASSLCPRSAGTTSRAPSAAATRPARRGLTPRRSAVDTTMGKWFPADWVSENREQIRLWFYSESFMSVTLVGRSPYRRVLTYEKLLDETGRDAPLVGQFDRRR